MRVISCIVHGHNIWFVLLAALMCVGGSYVVVTLFKRTLGESGPARFQWCFLSAVTAGAATWATHFIAMAGYNSPVPVTLDGFLTIVSALIAVVGIGAGLFVATVPHRLIAILAGGGTIGLAISAMHYTGMFAYRAQGIVQWNAGYVAASLAIATALSCLAIDRIRAAGGDGRVWLATSMLSGAIIGLHFTGMGAFSVSPLVGVPSSTDSEAFAALAAAIGMVALLIVGTGISTYLLEQRTSSEGKHQIAHIAMHDALTDLANRHQFNEALSIECTKLNRYGRPFALLMVDLDRFKPINDTLGHPIGDIVLQRISRRLRIAVRHGDLVARIGGDEFAIISFGTGDAATAELIASRVVEIISRPMIINGNIVDVSGSVGVAVAPMHGSTPDDLILHADVALYSAKHNGKQTYRLFTPDFMDAIHRRRILEAALRRACMRDDLKVVYQPVFDSCTGMMSGAEALLRWDCPTHGEVSPAEFIPVAEELGLVSRIGASVLRQACMDAASWPEHLDVAVNVSPVQLIDPRLTHTVTQALAESGLAPSRLELEITETALLNNDDVALRTLNQIKQMGVRISLDDFGTGYSSLSYLHRFPISRIKIDRSFVQRLPHDLGSASIVRAIAQLGESLSMKITAEGIETNDQLLFIREHGCDNVQGFLTGRPVCRESFLALARHRSGNVAA